MPRFDLLRDLDDRDFGVMRDVVRFGVLLQRHIQNRYDATPRVTAMRLGRLKQRGFVQERKEVGLPVKMWEATPTGTRVVKPDLHLEHRFTKAEHLRHDLALVDLADYCLSREPQAKWWAERELFVRKLILADPGHRPDGLLETGGKRLAIEFERTAKTKFQYEWIHRWFARALGIDGIRWYVTSTSIKRRIDAAIDRQGLFGLQVEVEFLPEEVEVLP
jgi:hypothetical protein